MNIKKSVKYVLTVIQICFIILPSIIYYLANRKMGVKRSLIYRNMNWNEQNLNKYMICGLIFILIIFIILAITQFIKKENIKNILTFIVINILCIIFSVKTNSELVLSYYAILISMNICLIIQVIKLNFKK